MSSVLLLMVALSVPPQAPPVEARLSAVEARLTALEQRCTCGVATTNSSGLLPSQTHPFLYNVGDTVNKPTGPAAAQFYAAGGWGGSQPATQTVCYNGSCYQVAGSAAGGEFTGPCAGGQCGAGGSGGSGCANGQCGQSSARRGLFGRRR